ncbi:MAG TPA: CoA-binding protein [Bacteroidales bacterium]|nr:CoA-binding protein [Bacteroidales bacterium]
MTQREIIDSFLDNKNLAIAGVSRNSKKFGNIIYKTLKEKGFQITPINPVAEEIEGQPCLKSVMELAPTMQHLLIATHKKDTARVLAQAVAKGIPYIWIQNGCESSEALKLAEEHKVNIISKACFLMYANPTGVHRFHKTVTRFFGGYISK